jgi:hypothetical protein
MEEKGRLTVTQWTWPKAGSRSYKVVQRGTNPSRDMESKECVSYEGDSNGKISGIQTSSGAWQEKPGWSITYVLLSASQFRTFD